MHILDSLNSVRTSLIYMHILLMKRNSSKKYVFLFLRENQLGDESVRVKVSLEGCTKDKKHQLEYLLQAYKEVFQEPKGLPHKREVEHEI